MIALDADDRTGDPAPDVPALDASARDVSEAEGVETVVSPERGRWLVELVVVFPDGVVRHRIDTFATRERAELSARLMKRAAERDLRGPLHG